MRGRSGQRVSRPPPAEGPPPAAKARGRARVGETVKLLVVDDRPADLHALKLILSEPGYELVTARSGPQALKRILAEDFALIVMDVLLPLMDGFEVAATIKTRDRSKHTPILFLTAAGADMRFIYRAYEVGAVDYLTKPIDPDVLKAKVAIFADLERKDRRIRRQSAALREADRRQKELELAELRRATERRYHNLADAIPAIVWTAAPDGGLLYANRRWHEYTGLAVARTRGWGWLDAIHPDDAPGFREGWQAAIAQEVEYRAECRIRRAEDDAPRWHLCHAIPERDRDGTGVIAWLATMTDTQDLRLAIQARDEFIAVASHELRAPLSSLTLANHALRLAITTDPVDRAGLISKVEVADRQAGRLHRLISALLDVTRIDGQHALLEPVDCDLAAIAREVVERLQEEAATAGSQLRLTGPASLTGRWDPLRLDQVLSNLVGNAIRHGGGQPIDVVMEDRGDLVRLAVVDRGEGIPPEAMARLFGRFQRGGSRRYLPGLGLGLFISRHIARAHGGEIWAVSEPGQGARFIVELPRIAMSPGEGARSGS